jgi:hypothetical protein
MDNIGVGEIVKVWHWMMWGHSQRWYDIIAVGCEKLNEKELQHQHKKLTGLVCASEIWDLVGDPLSWND